MRVVLSFLCGIICHAALAQHALEDSVKKLQEVAVYGKTVAVDLPGSRVIIPTEAMQNFYGQEPLTSLLNMQPSTYLKSYGNNMLSTISFRGTNASQTSVIWNNFSINNYTLGQTDFSTVPLAIVEEITLIPGGGSSFGGSGAIGGTIALGNPLVFKERTELLLQQSVGSFSTYKSLVSFKAGFGKWAFASKLYHNLSENDFTIPEKTKRQQNAAYQSYGVLQQIGFRLNSAHKFTYNFWYNYNYREIQPTTSSRFSDRNQEDENLRTTLNYQFTGKQFQLRAGTGYFQDILHYIDGGSSDLYDVDRIESFLKLTKYYADAHFLETEIRANNMAAVNPSYETGSAVENRYSALLKVGGVFFNRLDYAFHLRQQYISQSNETPLAPYAGLAYKLFDTNKATTTLKLSSALNYRVPTLNDRFWQNAGDPDLATERGFNNEIGLVYRRESSNWTNETNLTTYRNLITNYIQWVPQEGGNFAPNNIKQVEVVGLEANNTAEFTVSRQSTLSLNLGYSYNASTIISSENREFEEGKQLIYVPKHKASAAFSAIYQSWGFNYFLNATGRVFTTAQNGEAFSLSPFMLHAVSLSHSYKSFSASVKANNLFNSVYATYFGFAMPGRNFELTLNYTFK